MTTRERILAEEVRRLHMWAERSALRIIREEHRSVHGSFWEPRWGDDDGKRHPNECAPYLHAIDRYKKIGRGA